MTVKMMKDLNKKMIEEAITLYFHHKDLQEKGLLSVVNPRFLHLMHRKSLFAFGTSNSMTHKLMTTV